MDDVLAAKKSTVSWVGVRSLMRDSTQVGDGVLSYHSSCDQPGIVGIAQVASAAYTPTQRNLTRTRPIKMPSQNPKSRVGFWWTCKS